MILRSKDYRLAERLGFDARLVRWCASRALANGRTFRQQAKEIQRHRDSVRLLGMYLRGEGVQNGHKRKVRRYY